MAASKAPTNTTNVSYASSSTATTTNNIGHNFHELCRSCGKTNAELYDLFHATTTTTTTATSPFSTSSTTCYTHLNNCSSSSSACLTLFATNKPSTPITTLPTTDNNNVCTKSSSALALTFDSLAATAKASAKGQSNMDNILQEMQIWQLLIKCNDGLPQRICAKCTAQFYMIHKFRRKCLKVQTQLRALYEEQQKFYERQQQQKEKNVTVKDATTIEATSTPTALVAIAIAATEQPPTLGVKVVKPPVMQKVNDVVNDNYGEPQQQQQLAVVDNTNTKASVSFEANTGNTNDFIAPSTSTTAATTTRLDNTETMQQKTKNTEANEPTPTTSASSPSPALFIDKTFEAKTQEHCTITTAGLKLQDKKIPLLKPAVLQDCKRSPLLTLQQPLQKICDNDATTDQTNSSKKQCLDQEELMETHIIFKLNKKQNYFGLCHKADEQQNYQNTKNGNATTNLSAKAAVLNETIKMHLKQQLNLRQNCSGAGGSGGVGVGAGAVAGAGAGAGAVAGAGAGALNKVNAENLFITKAALKAYTIPPSTSETANRDYQKPITNSEAIELKNANDNNNNAHRNISSHHYDNRSSLQTEQNDNICSSTSNSNSNSPSALALASTKNSDPNTSALSSWSSSSSSSSSANSFCSSTMSGYSMKQTRTNIPKRKIIKYASHNRRPGHCYKLNAKAKATTIVTTKMARTILSYGGGMIIKRRKQRSPTQTSKHKLKHCRLSNTKTSSTFSTNKTTMQRKQLQQRQRQEKIKMRHKESLRLEQEQVDSQMKDEMSSIVSTTTMCTMSTTSTVSTTSATSLHLRATTPAVTDLVRNCAEVTSRHKNANENINNTADTAAASSSADRLSSNVSSSNIMWKTKAAMKANTNDNMLAEMPLNNDDDHNADAEISLPNTAQTTDLPVSSSLSLLCSPLVTENADKSSENLCENQSINNSSSLNNCLNNNNNNNNLMEAQFTIHNQIMSSPGNQVKDTKNESDYLQTAKILKQNLWPEEADQKQINTHNHHQQAVNEIQITNATGTATAASASVTVTVPITVVESQHTQNFDDSRKEQNASEQRTDEQQEKTHPAKSTGGMKLIIQRKRGARFKCRRKDDDADDNDEIPATHNNQESKKSKRKRKSSHNTNHLPNKIEIITASQSQDKPAITIPNHQETQKEFNGIIASEQSLTVGRSNEFINEGDDENKENPLPPETVGGSYELDSDSNVSVYRDPLLMRNEMLDEDTNVTDFPKTSLSLQSECSKEMYKLYKEKANLESPKKLIVRVPLTSLTQDFKKMHLTMDEQENENQYENANVSAAVAETETVMEIDTATVETNVEKSNEEILCMENLPLKATSSLQVNITTTESDFMGFSQSTESCSGTVDSSQPPASLQMRYIEPTMCTASSKINEFINDFQNNCIDSSEIEETCDIIPTPTLVPHMTQELSDEIRDVEDTLNGIISEMHDKDMYTPKSGETDELFGHSVYSPLTDSPTTPSQSFYAESPCTLNSNPMSVSPYVYHNMDYNAMTPQSNHSSMGPGSSYMGGSGANVPPPAGVYSSEHYPTYNECFEESTQSELIGFQNDIPCFENIEMTNSTNSNDQQQAETYEETEEAPNTAADNVEEEESPQGVDYVDLNKYEDEQDESDEFENGQTAPHPVTVPQHIAYNPGAYQHLQNTPTLQMQNVTNPLITNTAVTQPQHYIVTNTNQGPILIANPQLNQQNKQLESPFKPHSNNLQFVTLGQAMETNQRSTNQLLNPNSGDINWPTANFNQQSVLPATNRTTTYFINTNGGLYQANIPTTNLQNPAVNTIFVPPNTAPAFNKTPTIGNSGKYMSTMQQHQPQHIHQQNNGQSSQYIMLVNNLGSSPQYYTTATHATNLNQQTVTPPQHNITNTPTVLIHSAQQTQQTQQTPPEQQLQQRQQTPPTQPPQNVQNYQGNTEAKRSINVPIVPAKETQRDINQQLQKHLIIKPRQLHTLRPRSPSNAQKITLVCRFCQKRPKFSNNIDYSNHIIDTHPAENPYNCPHCPTHFARRSERQMHVAEIHGARYQCAQCGLSFCAQRILDFHLQKYHANAGGRPHQQNSSHTTVPATYQLLQNNQQQRLVRIEDVHVQVTGDNKNKRCIDLTLNGNGECDGSVGVGGGIDGIGVDGGVDIKISQSMNEVEMESQQQHQQQQEHHHHQQQQSRKLCCPDCNGDNDNCCGSNQNHDQHYYDSNATPQTANNLQQFNTGNESVNNNSQQHPPQHVTIPSPEQTEPDSTTTLRHFRKPHLSQLSPRVTSVSPSSSSSSSSSLSPSLHNNNAANNNNGGNDNINLNHHTPDNVMAGGDGGGGGGGGEQIVVERVLRGSHNCLLCEESFTNEIALRKHHYLAHGAATQSATCSSATTSSTMPPLVCTICKRGFRMRNALQRHMETHDAEGRPYECNICQVRFPRPSQLTLHKLTVHKFEKPTSCEECGKQFGTESAMKAHTAEHVVAKAKLTALASEATTAASTSTPSSQTPLISNFYVDTITKNTTRTSSSSTIEQNINLQSITSGDETISASVASSNHNDTFNNGGTQTVFVTGLAR